MIQAGGGILWIVAGILCVLYAEYQKSPIMEFCLVAAAAGCWAAGALCFFL